VNSPRLRPLGIGEILDVGIKIYFRHVGTFLRIIVFVVLPAQAVQAVVLVSAGVQQTSFSFNTSSNVTSANSGTYVAGYVIVLLISLFSTAIATGACFKAVADAYLEGAPDWKSSVKYAARRLHSILWISILGGILTALGLIGVLVGAVYLWVGFTVAVPVLLTEGLKGSKALRRSLHLIRGRWWPTFGLVLIGGLLAGVIGGIVSGKRVGMARPYRAEVSGRAREAVHHLFEDHAVAPAIDFDHLDAQLPANRLAERSQILAAR